MSGAVIAVYSLKGGVGKTTLAVNLAWAAAVLAGHKVLLWDLDGQAAASFILGHDSDEGQADRAIRKGGDVARLVRPTAIPGLDLLPADSSLRDLDVTFRDLDKKKRLARLAGELAGIYDMVFIDCPPGLTDTSDQILRAAGLVVVPVIPSALSRRALETIREHVEGHKGMASTILPVFSMVDRRRAVHRDALVAEPGWAAIPMASAFEAMAERRAPLGAFAPRRSRAVQAVVECWDKVAESAKATG